MHDYIYRVVIVTIFLSWFLHSPVALALECEVKTQHVGRVDLDDPNRDARLARLLKKMKYPYEVDAMHRTIPFFGLGPCLTKDPV